MAILTDQRSTHQRRIAWEGEEIQDETNGGRNS